MPNLTNLPPGFYQSRAAPTIPSNPYDEGAALAENRRAQSSQDPLDVMRQMQLLAQISDTWRGGGGVPTEQLGRERGGQRGGGAAMGFARLRPRDQLPRGFE